MTAVPDRNIGARVRDAEFPFTLTRDANSTDGQTFSGYAAVFNSPTHIVDEDGEYDEVIAPGAFRQTISRGKPVLMFNHGKHPLIGQMPLGKITELREDAHGLFVSAKLTDNWLIQPVRDAIRDGAIDGMSFRFEIVRDDVKTRSGGFPLRTLKEVKMPECGPVVFPAYKDTTASVRSILHALEENMPGLIHVDVIGETRENDGLIIDDNAEAPQELVIDAVQALWGCGDEGFNWVEMHDDHMLFGVGDKFLSDYKGLWRVDFTYNGDGTVTISDPVQQQAVGFVSTGTTPPTDLAQWDPNLNSADPSGETRAKYDAHARKTMAANGQALPDGSYPIADKEDLQNAIMAVGRGSGDHNAKALGASDMIPDSWNADGSTSGTNSQDPGPSKDATTKRGSSGDVAAAPTGPSTEDSRKRDMRQIQYARLQRTTRKAS